jgi:hypothetical protein
MSGRDGGRGGRGGFNDRDGGRGGFRDRDGGNFRDRDRAPRTPGGPPSRPWERRDDERPPRPSGDRPFDRPFNPPQERDVRVERYLPDEQTPRPPREERSFGDRPARFGGGDRDGGGRFGREGGPGPRQEPAAGRPAERPAPATAPRTEEPKGAAAAAARPTPQGWSQAHLLDSWLDEQRLKGWTPSDQDLQEMVEDNIEADPQVPGRDHRAISVRAQGSTVTLTGSVRSRAVKFAAGSDAYWTYGVSEVRNELLVKPRGPQAAGSAPAPVTAKAPAPAAAPEPAATLTAAPEPPQATAEPQAATVDDAPDEVDVVAPTTRRTSRRKAASESTDED